MKPGLINRKTGYQQNWLRRVSSHIEFLENHQKSLYKLKKKKTIL